MCFWRATLPEPVTLVLLCLRRLGGVFGEADPTQSPMDLSKRETGQQLTVFETRLNKNERARTSTSLNCEIWGTSGTMLAMQTQHGYNTKSITSTEQA
jgi:hypothetical protein